MPKTRRDTQRDDKVAEILDAADKQVAAGGAAALSVAAISRDLGVAQNAIYWYFPSRDHVFVAVLERRFHAILNRRIRPDGDLTTRVLRIVDSLHEFSPLLVAAQQEAARSAVVAEFVNGVEGAIGGMLSATLREHVPAPDLPMATSLLITTLEGAFVRRVGRAERRRLIEFALQRLVSTSGPARARKPLPTKARAGR